MNNSKYVKLVGLAILIVSFFSVGFMSGRLSSSSRLSGDNKNMNLFWEVWNTVTGEYVDSDAIDEDAMYYGSIKGMVNSIDDPATTFLDPEETEEFNKSIEGKTFEGIGAELSYEEGRIVVVAPLPGSPAQKAGVKIGDTILKIDGKSISSNESIYDVVARIRGESGTEVVLTVLHKGQLTPVEIKIVRGEIDVPSMEIKSVAGHSDMKILRITRFTDESVSTWDNNWDKAVLELAGKNLKGLIIDLRGNPGGFFDSAVYSASEFFPKGVIISKQQDKNGNQEVFRSTRDGKLQTVPIVVLIDEGSASASEILAGALMQNDRATVVGVSSYGKGTAQTIVDFDDGSSLHLTIMKWLLPDGRSIDRDNPIAPDVVVEYSDTEFVKGNDVQLNKAVEILNK